MCVLAIIISVGFSSSNVFSVFRPNLNVEHIKEKTCKQCYIEILVNKTCSLSEIIWIFLWSPKIFYPIYWQFLDVVPNENSAYKPYV